MPNAPAISRITVTIPGLRVQSEMNAREHWAARNKRKHEQQANVLWELRRHVSSQRRCHVAGGRTSHKPLRVTMTRIYTGRGRALDSDNLTTAFKFIRDAVAKWLGRDDSPTAGIEWITAQERGEDYAVRITIEEVNP